MRREYQRKQQEKQTNINKKNKKKTQQNNVRFRVIIISGLENDKFTDQNNVILEVTTPHIDLRSVPYYRIR